MTTEPVVLGPELTIVHAAVVHEALCEAVSAAPGDLTLDLSAVTEFDSSAVQLLLATRRSLAQRGHSLRLSAASAAVRDALATFGLLPQWPELAGAA